MTFTQYMASKEMIQRWTTHDPANRFERLLFHGTQSENVNSICVRGFDRSRAKQQGMYIF